MMKNATTANAAADDARDLQSGTPADVVSGHAPAGSVPCSCPRRGCEHDYAAETIQIHAALRRRDRPFAAMIADEIARGAAPAISTGAVIADLLEDEVQS